MIETLTPRHSHCSSCGRRHTPRPCAEPPKGADAWKRVSAARKSASPIHTSLTARNA